jgi:hypothetical protein
MLRRPTRKWVDNIKIDFKEIRCEGVDWIHLTSDRDQCWALVNMIMDPCVHRVILHSTKYTT